MKVLDGRTTSDLVKLLIFIVVTTLATSVLVMTIGNISFSPKQDYKAEFVDATGVVKGDDVRVAGVKVGTVQDVRAIAEVAHVFGIPFHTDAVQAAGHLPVDFAASGADLMSVTAHKLGGPIGVGALVARRDVKLVPLSHGGGQERQVRSGTLDTPAVVGFAAALVEATAAIESESARLVALRDDLVQRALALSPDIRVTGAWTRGDGSTRLPGNAHLLVPGCDGDSLLYLLDAAGVSCSTCSACQAGVPQPSHVLLAMGVPESDARGALRVTLGHTSSQADVDAFVDALPAAIERARRAREATAS